MYWKVCVCNIETGKRNMKRGTYRKTKRYERKVLAKYNVSNNVVRQCIYRANTAAQQQVSIK